MAASVGNEGDHMFCLLISETSWLVGPCRAVAKALYPERSHWWSRQMPLHENYSYLVSGREQGGEGSPMYEIDYACLELGGGKPG